MRVASFALAAALVLGACSANPAERPSTGGAPAPTPTTAVAATPTDPVEAEATPLVTIARADTPLTVRAEPVDDAAVVSELPATTTFGSPRALLVLDEADGWVRVQVPARPNGASGWIPVDAVDLVTSHLRVLVDLTARRLAVYEDDRVVLSTPVAIGAPEAPTPTGTFALVDLLQTTDGSGPYGPFALGLGGYSETFSEFAGGDGQIGIHGTDDPSSIGQAVSHGCVRVPNEVAARLAGLLPLGTPVTIR